MLSDFRGELMHTGRRTNHMILRNDARHEPLKSGLVHPDGPAEF